MTQYNNPYVDQFSAGQTLASIAASLKWRYDLALPEGNSEKAKAVRTRDAMLKDGEYQNFRVQQKYFAPFGVNTAPYTEAEANTLRLKNMVDNMSDDQVNKFERVYQAYPNQSPGFYISLVDNPQFDVNHPEFENIASLDLEENAKQQGQLRAKQIGSSSWVDDALIQFGAEPYTTVPGSYYTAGRKNRPGNGLLLPTGDQTADSAGNLPSGYEGLYGTGGLQGVNEGINRTAGGALESVNRAGEGVDWLNPVRTLGRDLFAAAISPQQAVIGTARSTFGAAREEGGIASRLGKTALSGLSWLPGVGAVGNAVYGDENFNSAWEQTFAGQMRAAGYDTGEGWFPAGKTAELQAKSVWDTYNLDGQVWSLGVEAAHSLGMDPDTSAYHYLSGTIDATAAIMLDPTLVFGKFALPSKGVAATGRGLARVLPVSAQTGAKIESITLRGGAKAEETRAAVMRSRLDTEAHARAIANGEDPQAALYASQLIDYIAAHRTGETAGKPLSQQFQGDLDLAGAMGVIRAAEDHVAKYDAEGQIASLDTQISRTRKDKLAIKRGLADDILVPDDLTGVDKDFYRAYTTLFRNKELMDVYHSEATRLTDEASGLRRPEYEQDFVNTYVTDIGNQLDLAASKQLTDIGEDFRDIPDSADSVVRQTLDELQNTHQMTPTDGSVALEGLVQGSRFGPLPESIYTISEPDANNMALGRVNGEDAIVQFKDAPRAKVDDPVINEAQKILTTAQPTPTEGFIPKFKRTPDGSYEALGPHFKELSDRENDLYRITRPVDGKGWQLQLPDGQIVLYDTLASAKKDALSHAEVALPEKFLTPDAIEVDPARVQAINDDLVARLNVDPEILRDGGFLLPLDRSQPFNFERIVPMLFDAEGKVLQGADLMSALLRLINAEPSFPRNMVHASEPVRQDILLAAKRVLLEVADSIGKDVTKVVDKHMSKALSDFGNKDLTVEKIREDILGMTDLRSIIEKTLGVAIDAGDEITYGQLLSLAGRVGGHGKLAEMLSESGVQGIRALNEDGTGVWWSDRSIIKAGAFDMEDVLSGNVATISPLKHNDPFYMLVGRQEGEGYKALTLKESQAKARKDQQDALAAYFGNIRIGAKGAADARRDYTVVQRRQSELQYLAARAIAGMDVQKLAAGGGLPDEVLSYLDGEGALPSPELISRTLDQLEEVAKTIGGANETLMHAIRSNNGIYTDFRNGDVPIMDPRMSINEAKRALNADSPLHPIMRRAFSKLANEKSMSSLIQKTRNKWDEDAYKVTIANAHKTEIRNPDGTVTPYTDAMREEDFIRTAATQLGQNMKSSVRGVRTVIEPGDGPKFGRTIRNYAGQKLDRWSAYAPNAQSIDLSNFNAVAQRIIDLGQFHKLGAEAMDKSLDILLGDGNRQQLARHAIEDAMNKTNDSIIEGFAKSEFTREQMDSLKALVRRRTSYSLFRRDNEARQTYTQQQVIGKGETWQLADENGNLVERPAVSHLYFNEQVNNFMNVPSTVDLIGLQRKFLKWKEIIAKTKDLDDGSKLSALGTFGRTLDYMYLNLYRTTLLLRPAYMVRNLLEMDVRAFLANSPVSLFSHPLSNTWAVLGQIAPKGSPLAKPERPFWGALKKNFGIYDQTPLGRDFADYGDETAEMASRTAHQIEQGRHSLSDERTNRASQIMQRDYHPVDITDHRWAEGLSHELFSMRTTAVARMVASDGLTGSQLAFLNHHLEKMGKEKLLTPQTGEMETLLYPVAVFMHEALHNPDALKKSLDEFYRGSREFEPGKAAQVEGLKDWWIDQTHQYMDSLRSSERGVEGGETPTSVLITSTPENVLSTMLLGSGGYLERIRERTFGFDQRLVDYIAHGGFHPDGYPIGQAIPEEVRWISDIKSSKNELKSIRTAINEFYGSQITEAKRIYDTNRGGVPTPEANEIAQMVSSVRTFVVSDKWDKARIGSLFDYPADMFFSLSSKGERRLKMGPEFRARLWGVMGDNVDTLSTAALANSEQAAIRTLSPLRRLTKGLPGPEIGRSHPYFRGIERNRAKVDDYNIARAEVETAKAEGREAPQGALDRIKMYSEDGTDLETAYDVADTMAYEYVKDLFYDASRKRNLWFSMRYASMFIAPAMNTLSVWTKLMTEKPTQVYKAYKAAYALQQEGTGDVMNTPEEGMTELERALHATNPNKAFLFKDQTGWQINVPAVGKLAGLIPGANITPGMVGPTTMRLENLNFAMSAGSILPGVSPMISMPYAAFKGDTDHAYEKFLDNWFLPFGERSVLEQVMPSWLSGTMVGLTKGGFGLRDELLLQNFKPAMAALYASGNYDSAMTDKVVNAALREDAIDLAASMTFWQSIGQAILPSRPLVDWAAADKTGDTVGISTLSSLFYDKEQGYLAENHGDYEGAMTQMYDDFGMTGIFAITGAKDNLGRIPSSSGWNWITANPELAKGYDKYIYYFFPADEGDMRARIWMEERGLRTQLSANEQMEAVRSQFLIMRKAQINEKYVGGIITEDDAVAAKKQAAAQFGDASEYEQKDIATPDQFPNILDEMLKIPEFRNTPAGGPAAYAMTWRKYYMDLASETGESLGTKKNVDLKNEYYARLNGILNQTGGQRSQAVEIIDMLKKEF